MECVHFAKDFVCRSDILAAILDLHDITAQMRWGGYIYDRFLLGKVDNSLIRPQRMDKITTNAYIKHRYVDCITRQIVSFALQSVAYFAN